MPLLKCIMYKIIVCMGDAMLMFTGELGSKCLCNLCIRIVLVRPVIVLKLRFIFRVTVFHSDAAR